MSASPISFPIVPALPALGLAGWPSSLVSLQPQTHWERLPDGQGLARWYIRTSSPLSSRILASRDDGLMVVAIEGRLWSASNLHELAEGLVQTFAHVDIETYRALLLPLHEAWTYLGHQVSTVVSEVPYSLERVATAFDDMTEEEVG